MLIRVALLAVVLGVYFVLRSLLADTFKDATGVVSKLALLILVFFLYLGKQSWRRQARNTDDLQ